MSTFGGSHKLTVLQVRSEFDDNGCATMALQIGRELGRRGHRAIFASSGGVFSEQMEREGMKHITVDSLHTSRRDALSTWRNIRAMARILREENVDVIHSHNAAATGCAWIARALARRRWTPIIQSVHGLELRASHAWRNWIYPVMPVVYLPVSKFTSDWLGEIGVPEHRRPVVYNGVDRSVFDHGAPRGQFRKELGLPEEALLVGTLGQVNTWKNQEGLVRLAPEIQKRVGTRPVHFVFIGKGPRIDHCRALSIERGIADRVHLLGFRPSIVPILADLDLVVQPSARGEMLPVAILESMAMGKPWVASHLSGIPELATYGCGITVPPGDDSRLVEEVARLLQDEAQRGEMGKAAMRAAETSFDIRVIVDQMLGHYRRVLPRVEAAPGPALADPKA